MYRVYSLMVTVIFVHLTVFTLEEEEHHSCQCVFNQIWCSGAGLQHIPIISISPENTTKYLDLSNNHIRSISWELQLYPFLLYLNLSNNSLTITSGDAFRDMFFLEELDLSGNNLNSFSLTDSHFQSLTSLKVLSLAHNYLGPGFDISVFRYLETLTCLDLDHNNIVFFHGGENETGSLEWFLPSLAELRLRGNFLLNIPVDIWPLFPNLISLDISQNAIRTIQRNSLTSLTHLKSLTINNMSTLHSIEKGAFGDMPILQSLMISHCQMLRVIENGAFGKLEGILNVHLENNDLQVLSERLLPWDEVSHLYLHGNQWACDCRMRWIQDLARKRGLMINCSSPEDVKSRDITSLSDDDFHCGLQNSVIIYVQLRHWEIIAVILPTVVLTSIIILCGVKLTQRVRQRKGEGLSSQMSYGSLHALYS